MIHHPRAWLPRVSYLSAAPHGITHVSVAHGRHDTPRSAACAHADGTPLSLSICSSGAHWGACSQPEPGDTPAADL